MLPFSALLLREYYRAIGWNEDNSYSQITRSSSALLDFQIPQSLALQLANSPTPIFFTSYSLDALPQLNGAISYITTSEALDNIGPSRSVGFKHVVERFRVYPPPVRPRAKEEVWQGGRRVEGRDYLLYSRLHLPSLHLSGLCTTRLTPTLQAHLAFLSPPTPSSPSSSSSSSSTSSTSTSPEGSSSIPQTPGNVLLSIQHDVGRGSWEGSYSAQDGMVGLRGLWNFGWNKLGLDSASKGGGAGYGSEDGLRLGEKERVDEEEMMDGGLRGRFSAGGEVYFSAKQRSFGISTGLRFTTIPSSFSSHPTTPAPSNFHPHITPPPNPSPPTTLTLLYNPLIGFISTAYSAQVSPTVALSTRFGVNVYSYESDLSLGGEWWVGRKRGKRPHTGEEGVEKQSEDVGGNKASVIGGRTGGRDARMGDEIASLRDVEDVQVEKSLDSPIPLKAKTESVAPHPVGGTDATVLKEGSPVSQDRDGVIKARISGNWVGDVLIVVLDGKAG